MTDGVYPVLHLEEMTCTIGEKKIFSGCDDLSGLLCITIVVANFSTVGLRRCLGQGERGLASC